MKNPDIQLTFENHILDVKYLDHAVIDVADIQDIYSYGNLRSHGKPYCVMFEPMGTYEVTENAVSYMIDNPDNKNILAKVYILNSKESETKAKFHFLFDRPELKPVIFKTAAEGRKYLVDLINKQTP